MQPNVLEVSVSSTLVNLLSQICPILRKWMFDFATKKKSAFTPSNTILLIILFIVTFKRVMFFDLAAPNPSKMPLDHICSKGL